MTWNRRGDVWTHRAAVWICAACCCAALTPASLSAQHVGRSTLNVAGGLSYFDFGGAEESSRQTGSSFVIAARFNYSLATAVIAEASVSYFEHTEEPTASTERSILPEVGVQLSGPVGIVRPYAGVGGGLEVRLRQGTWRRYMES